VTGAPSGSTPTSCNDVGLPTTDVRAPGLVKAGTDCCIHRFALIADLLASPDMQRLERSIAVLRQRSAM
jgi:hypothetical protein